MDKMRVVLVTNIPAPYRIPVYNRIAETLGDDFTVIYCSHTEPNRNWDLQEMKYRHVFLNERMIAARGERYIHMNGDIIEKLRSADPDVVITTGFSPTFLCAFLWARIKGLKHIPMTDGTPQSESTLGFTHSLLRKIVFSQSSAFIGAGEGSKRLYERYKVRPGRIFKSCLCVDNEAYSARRGSEREYDVMFSGQFIDRKMPFFVIEVLKKVRARGHRCRLLLMGDGPLKERIIGELQATGMEYRYAGFRRQAELPSFYSSAKLFLFPTMSDPWGIVANEACAAGTPVLTCRNAGAADDLVINGENGFVLPLDADLWAEKTVRLLGDKELYDRLSGNAVKAVAQFNFDRAADGVIQACRAATC